MTLGSSSISETFLRLSEQLIQFNHSNTTASLEPKSRLTSCSTDSGIHFEQTSTSGMNNQQLDIEDELRRELMSTRQLPYRDYVCHRCGMRGHMIQHCPTKDSSNEPTPYQGDKKSIGYFTCTKCHRNWKSSNAFANRTQKCSSCGHPVFPKKMLPLKNQTHR